MECLFGRTLRTWCAVGFKNAANDTDEHVKGIQRKFQEDADSARDNDADLKGFVFMTNVHLTDGEKQPLKDYAKSKGFVHCDIFNREDLVGALDSVGGFPFRLRYLDIEMSKEDQLAFVDRYQQQLLDIVTKQRQSVDARLERLEFLQWARQPINEISLVLEFRKPCILRDLGQFRICMQIVEIKKGHLNSVALYVENGTRPCPDGKGDDYGYLTRLPSNNAEIQEGREEFSIAKDAPQSHLSAGIMHFDDPPNLRLADLHRRDFHLHATDNIASQILGVTLVIDSYAVLQDRTDGVNDLEDMMFEPTWDHELAESEMKRWREVPLLKTIGGFDWQRNPPFPLF
jgi:hypothetical protein